MFKKIEEAEALVVSNGVYKEAEVYEGPQGGLFAKVAGGFVRIKENGSTSHNTIRLENLMHEGPLYRDQWGRLCASSGKGRKEMRIAGGDELKLLPKD